MATRLTPRQLGVGVGITISMLSLWLVGLIWFRPWVAHDDFAIFRIALERELDGHIRLVGAHSRLGVFHPGPLREWVFALPYWLSGHRSAALPATSIVLNVGWAIWTLVVARRLRPRVWGAACAFGLLLAVVAVGADLGSPWNPHLAILPMYLACWSLVTVTGRRGEGWVACVCSASFAAQLHASVLVVAGAVLAVALMGLAWQRLRTKTLAAFGLALLLWSGPIFDLRNGAQANLIRLRTVGADGASVGLSDAAGHVSRLLWPGTPISRDSVRPSIIEFTGFARWWLLLIVVALGLTAIVAWRRLGDVGGGARSDVGVADEHGADAAPGCDMSGAAEGELDRPQQLALAASLVAGGVLAVSVVSISLFVEPVYRYLYGPLQGVAAFVLAVVVGAALTAVERRHGQNVPNIEWVVAAVVPVAMVAVLLTVPREDGDSAARRALDVENSVSAALSTRPTWQQVEALPLDLRGAGDLDAEVLDVVYRRGYDARSRRSELGLPAPDDADGVFAVTMSPSRDCLLAEPDVEEIIRGVSHAGETFSVVAVDVGSAAFDRCIGPPAAG